jgi:hypothetical protein
MQNFFPWITIAPHEEQRASPFSTDVPAGAGDAAASRCSEIVRDTAPAT